MTYRGPQVLPEAYGTDWGPRIAQALVANDQRNRQADIEAQRKREADVGYYEHGGRTGTAPDDTVSITTPGTPSFTPPSNADLSRVFMGGSMTPAPARVPFDPNPPQVFDERVHPTSGSIFDEQPRGFDPSADQSGGILRRSLGGGGYGGGGGAPDPAALAAQFGASGDDYGTADTTREQAASQDLTPRTTAPTHPGAFDPASRTFGGSPLQMATAAQHALPPVDAAPMPAAAPASSMPVTRTLPNSSPRFVQIDPTHYIDTWHTPEADRERDREAQLQMAAAFRGQDIAQRGQQQVTLEQVKQQGRESIRNNINAAAQSNIALRGAISGTLVDQRGDIQAKNQNAHDLRTRETDLDVAKVRSGALGGRPTAAAENNIRRAADGIIGATGGSYDQAVDWLNNSPEGKQAQASGVTAAHLYEAQGRFLGHTSDVATRLVAGPAAMSPGEAATTVGETNTAVRGAARPGSAEAKLTQQRADYDAAAAALRKQRKTQGEITATLGPRP